MTSVLESNYVPPSRPYSTNELSDMRENFYKKNNLSSIKAYHKSCGHFYYVKENGRKQKELSDNNENIGNCSCCWKLNKTPKNLIDKAEDLVNIYSKSFNDCPSHMTYDLVDLEICFYRWLYNDRYDDRRDERRDDKSTNFKKKTFNQKKNLKVNTNV